GVRTLVLIHIQPWGDAEATVAAAREAGVRTLVLIHIQPWGDAEATVAAAREEFDGEIVLGTAGMQF
ncbi:hypothetical protein V5S92_07950, partial [Corynebacterium accolens]